MGSSRYNWRCFYWRVHHGDRWRLAAWQCTSGIGRKLYYIYGRDMTKKFSEYDRVNQWDLPVIVDPGRIKVCFDIPYERYHIRAFWTALYKLTLWNSWAADDNHTGREAAIVWWQVLNDAMNDPNTIGCGDEIN